MSLIIFIKLGEIAIDVSHDNLLPNPNKEL